MPMLMIRIPHPAAGSVNVVVSSEHVGVSEERPEYLVRIELVFEEIARRRRSSSSTPERVYLGALEIVGGGSGLVVHPSGTVVAQTLESLGNLLERVFGAWSFVLIGMNFERELPIRFSNLFHGATLL